MPQRDCCPAGSHSPCDDGSRNDLKALAELCCAGAPAASSAVAADPSRAAYVQQQDSGSPDPVALIAWFATLTPRNYEVPPPPPDPLTPRTDATPTFLRTLRLRL